LNAEKATTELCPPKPNEFEMAAYDRYPLEELKKLLSYTNMSVQVKKTGEEGMKRKYLTNIDFMLLFLVWDCVKLH